MHLPRTLLVRRTSENDESGHGHGQRGRKKSPYPGSRGKNSASKFSPGRAIVSCETMDASVVNRLPSFPQGPAELLASSAVGAVGPGVVERSVGAGDELLRGLTRGQLGDSHGHRPMFAGCRERCLDLRESRNDIAFGHFGQRAEEFVTSEADDKVDGPQLPSQRLDKLDQHPVTRDVSTRVVHGLELIDVKEPQHQRLPCAPRPVDHPFQFGDSGTTLVDAGETIEGGVFPVPGRRPAVRGGMRPLGGAHAPVDQCCASIHLGFAALVGTCSPIQRGAPPVSSSLAARLTGPIERVPGDPWPDRRFERLSHSISRVSGSVTFVTCPIALIGSVVSSVRGGVAQLPRLIPYPTGVIALVSGVIALVGGSVPLVTHMVALIAHTLSSSPCSIPLVGGTVALVPRLVTLVSAIVSVVSGIVPGTVRNVPTLFELFTSAIDMFPPLFDVVALPGGPPAAVVGPLTFDARQVALPVRFFTLLSS
jgi:hypothetical protein